MTDTRRRLVTVIAESALERELARELDALGIRGYTVTEARGRGQHGERSSGWSHSANIRMEVLCEAGAAAQLVAAIRDRYFTHHAIVLYVHDVEVVRPDRF